MIQFEYIKLVTAEHFGLAKSDLSSPNREHRVAHPRQITMYFGRRMTTLSLPQIGRQLGGRDHTTVLFGTRQVESRMLANTAFGVHVREIEDKLLTGSEAGCFARMKAERAAVDFLFFLAQRVRDSRTAPPFPIGASSIPATGAQLAGELPRVRQSSGHFC